jgi:hypothetical protein
MKNIDLVSIEDVQKDEQPINEIDKQIPKIIEQRIENNKIKIGISTKVRLDKSFIPETNLPTYLWDNGNGKILRFKVKITKKMKGYLRELGILTKELQLDEHRDIKITKIAGIQISLSRDYKDLEWINPPNYRKAKENYKEICRILKNRGYLPEKVGCKPIYLEENIKHNSQYCEEEIDPNQSSILDFEED